MGRRLKTKFTTLKYKKDAARKLVDLCIEAMAPNVIADVTSRPRPIDYMSLRWDLDEGLFIGNRDLSQEGEGKWDIRREMASASGKAFWTAGGMLGRIRGLCACQAFSAGSLVDKMSLFMASEVNISFTDLRTVFRYMFGVNDAELYACIKELIKQNVVTLGSMRSRDSMAIGPFILQAVGCGRESFECMFDPAWADEDSGCTWYHVLSLSMLKLDGLIMRMFIYCMDDIDTNVQGSPDNIKAFHALDDFYGFRKGSLDECYPYLQELLRIKTRDIITGDFGFVEDDVFTDKYMMTVVLDETLERSKKKIFEAAQKCNRSEEYQYIPIDTEKICAYEETADKSDIGKAIQMLKDNMHALRKDAKTGKVINAEKIIYILEEIQKIFSLKSLYEIFRHFDTDAEVVRRDVRALCKKGDIVSAGRGLYCSKKFADAHFAKVGSMNASSEPNTLQEQLTDSLMKRLNDGLELFIKNLNRFNKPDKS